MQISQKLLDDIKTKFETILQAQNLAITNDEKLLSYLLELSPYKDEYKKRFFIAKSGALIFNKDEFVTFLDTELKGLGYTRFLNKIGLSSDNKFLKSNEKVVLDFPFKDCVLQGSCDKEDVKTKELFFNNIIEKDEIDVLFDKKVLCDFYKFNQQSAISNQQSAISNQQSAISNQQSAISAAENFIKFSRNLELNRARNLPLDTICDNLIIKGNNLLALHTLKSNFAGRVKLIYIDPPYNTQTDASTFAYNNNFNHSTWLTFIKNRVEVAREFLKDDGIFCCSIDHCELFYLGVLLDEIFGRENRIGLISIETNPGGRSDSKFLATSSEYCIIYAKNINLTSVYDINKDKDKLLKYNKQDSISRYKLVPLRRTGSNSTPDKRKNLCYPIYYNINKKQISVEIPNNTDEWIEIMPMGVDIMRVWRWSKNKVANSLSELEVVLNNKNEYNIYVKDRLKTKEKAKTMWYGSRYDASANGTKVLQKLQLSDSFSYPKSVFLIQDIISMTTNENDIVMDFFLGSGTTAAVAHKMNRQYIGIEQMDYIENVSIERLKKVIEGEQGGISKTLNWQGGGSFIYAKLMPLNEIFKKEILKAKDDKELDQIYKKLQKVAFIDYRINLRDIAKDKEFVNLSLNEKKEVLNLCLDSNMDYVLLSDIDDVTYEVDSNTKALNKAFYGEI